MSNEQTLSPEKILRFLVEAIRQNPHRPELSDLHIHPGSPPRGRFRGRIRTITRCLDGGECRPLTPQEINGVIEAMLEKRPWGRERFRRYGGADFAYELSENGHRYRFRISAFRTLSGPALTIRAIPQEVPPPRKLGLPEERLYNILLKERPQGLFLVVGATGSGKSTTLASILNAYNRPEDPEIQKRIGGKHIITIEDPIEFVFAPERAVISQRELGTHVPSFAEGLRQALRQDPDIIMVGEIRDAETAATALAAARTGHLVLSTLHTDESVSTLSRLLSFFKNEEREQVLYSIAHNLLGILSQRLVPTSGGERVLIYELLEATPHIRDLIAEGNLEELRRLARETGRDQSFGALLTFDYALAEKVLRGDLSFEEALPYATSPANFKAHWRHLQELRQTGEWHPSGAVG